MAINTMEGVEVLSVLFAAFLLSVLGVMLERCMPRSCLSTLAVLQQNPARTAQQQAMKQENKGDTHYGGANSGILNMRGSRRAGAVPSRYYTGGRGHRH